MVKYLIIYILLVIIFSFCTNDKKLILKASNNSLNDKISLGVYIMKYYDYSYFPKKEKMKDGNFEFIKVKTDSVLMYKGYKFFTNGIFRQIESYKELNILYMEKLLEKRKYDKSNWGVYNLKNDTINIKGWGASQGQPIYEIIGSINKTELIEYKRRCFSCSKWEYGYKWDVNKVSYDAKSILLKIDSTTEFIKPLNNNINEK